MQYRTHMITSITAAVAITSALDAPMTIGVLTGVAAGSLMPDLDHPQSKLGRRSLGVAFIINKIFGHRGFTHSLLAALLMFLPFYFTQNTFLLGMGLGYILHILGDMFSKSGVPLFHPFTKMRVKIPLYQTGGFLETIIRYISIGVLIYLVVKGEIYKEVFISIVELLK